MAFSSSRLKRQIRAPLVKFKYLELLRAGTRNQFKVAGVTPVPIKIQGSKEPATPNDMILRREGGRIVGLINHSWLGYRYPIYQHRIGAYAYWFSKSPNNVQQITVDLADGHSQTSAQYRYSVTSDLYTPLPDAHFFRDRGYAETDAYAAEQAPAWDDRHDDIVWRGAPNGTGMFSLDPAVADNPGVIQRLRMAQKCRNLDIDFRFLFDPKAPHCNVLQAAGLTGDRTEKHYWGGKKYAVDIDGFSNAWCNFMQRLKLGCCVLKVDSQFGFYQWYYHKIAPWEHFVPIKADLSDLAEQIDWVKSNPAKAKAIAAQGQAFAKTLTFESECAAAAQAIEERAART